MNSHNWYGLLSYYTNKFSDLFKLTAGFDGRFYQGIHREVIEDLLGGDYYIEPQNSSTKLMYHNPYQPLQVGDYIPVSYTHLDVYKRQVLRHSR